VTNTNEQCKARFLIKAKRGGVIISLNNDIAAIKDEYPDVRLDISFDEREYLKGKK